MSLAEMVDIEMTPLAKGWALPIRKPNTSFTDKQRDYLQNKLMKVFLV
jgi:hypothetical protein